MTRSPQKITEGLYKKSFQFLNKSVKALIIGGILAGVFVGIAAITTILVTHDMQPIFGVGFTKLISGVVFTFGLVTIVLSGSELFTGSNMHIVAAYKDKRNLKKILKNWSIIYIANFIGSIIIVYAIIGTGVYSNQALSDAFINIAKTKINLAWSQAFIKGILCNFLVCLAVRVGESSENVPGKILGYIFVIGAFVINGFEHSIANMFFIPTGIILSSSLGMHLTWQGFFIDNLIPVTLGNIIGGALFIGTTYYIMHMESKDNEDALKKSMVNQNGC